MKLHLIYFYTIAVVTFGVWGQGFEQYDTQNVELYNPERLIERKYERWFSADSEPIKLHPLKEPVPVKVAKPTILYSHPHFVTNPEDMPGSLSGYRAQSHCELRKDSNISGNLIYVKDGIAAIKVTSKMPCGGDLNDGLDEPHLVFLRANALREAPEGIDVEGERANNENEAAPPCTDCDISMAKNEGQAIVDHMKKFQYEMLTDYFKKPQEFEKYIQCWSPSDQRANYRKLYQRLFDQAGVSFAVFYDPAQKGSVVVPADSKVPKGDPFLLGTRSNILKCLALRESKFDRNAKSPEEYKNKKIDGRFKKVKVSGGAMGIAQQVEVNVADISCALNGCTKPIDPKKLYKGTYFQEPKPWAQAVWKKFFRDVKGLYSAQEWKELTTRPDGSTCGEGFQKKELDAICPINSIAALAINVINLEIELRKQSSDLIEGDYEDFQGSALLHALVATGGGHNGGIGNLSKAVKKSKKPSDFEKNMVKLTDRPGELGPYMKYLRSCLEHKNFSPPWDTVDPEDRAAEKAKAARCEAEFKLTEAEQFGPVRN